MVKIKHSNNETGFQEVKNNGCAFVGFVKTESTWFDETLVFEENGLPTNG